MERVKALTLAAVMGALANILAFPPIAVHIVVGGFDSSIHFSQLAIFVCGVLAGPFYGLIAGAIGSLFMAVYLPGIPFVIVGLAILGLANGLFAKKLRPLFAGVLAWCVQAPYVVITDYVWFTLFLARMPAATWTILATIMTKLTIEAVTSATLVDVIIRYVKRTGLVFTG